MQQVILCWPNLGFFWEEYECELKKFSKIKKWARKSVYQVPTSRQKTLLFVFNEKKKTFPIEFFIETN